LQNCYMCEFAPWISLKVHYLNTVEFGIFQPWKVVKTVLKCLHEPCFIVFFFLSTLSADASSGRDAAGGHTAALGDGAWMSRRCSPARRSTDDALSTQAEQELLRWWLHRSSAPFGLPVLQPEKMAGCTAVVSL